MIIWLVSIMIVLTGVGVPSRYLRSISRCWLPPWWRSRSPASLSSR
ncbi:hypothetical protein I551_4004 [Mycobacterium ulcerans str. Harvey]|uniref:Uncharacterized protein n=1 Tax=Mycobacterium ulcerans str. Harvey TaxID=1299332 RepID=A0ABP3AIN2_MYCUL|nr:hypothetical protein I551_4004 [Mycobacterium ulcerans str. Harvey]